MTPFDAALAFTLPAEGGFVNEPHDHGGSTNRGITQASYDEWRMAKGEVCRSVREIEQAEVMSLYGMMYWMPAHCEAMASALAVCHFDWAVNHGVQSAISTLQEALHVEADGEWGPKTQEAMDTCNQDGLRHGYNALRRDWYQVRVAAHPDQAVFLKGWLSRVDRLDAYVEGLR